MFDLVCLGEALIDWFPAETGRDLTQVSAFHQQPGGAPANVAVAAVHLGARCAFIGKVGDDPFGHYLAESLRQEGVETQAMRFDHYARTGLNFHAQVDEHTSTHLFYRHPSADMRLLPAELDREALAATRIFYCGSLSLSAQPIRHTTQEAVRLARAAGALVAFDVNYRPSLWVSAKRARHGILEMLPYVDVLKVNEAEAEFLTGSADPSAATHWLSQRGPRLCVMTLGPDGCFYRTGERCGRVSGFPIATVDATGCGDAFMGSLLTQVAQQRPESFAQLDLGRLLKWANAAGALTATKPGVFEALPHPDAIAALVTQRELAVQRS